VIIHDAPGTTPAVAAVVKALGGNVTSVLTNLDTITAKVPASTLNLLSWIPGVIDVTPNASLKLLDGAVQKVTNSTFGGDTAVNGKAPQDDPGSLFNTDRMINAPKLWNAGDTGQGVDVALIDSGITPVPGLDAPGKIVYGPDLSFDSQDPDMTQLDGYGHGTHMAGIIAAKDGGLPANINNASPSAAVGVAPDARIVSVKVAAADGSTDVSQVIAGINWVIEHQHDNGLNIRVLNLSFDTDGSQSYQLDPLTYAAEAAWRHGIVVVVAAGNDGVSAPLGDPAYDPYVIAVGASDHKGTVGAGDDTIADFSSRGSFARRPDIAAPGRSITSLRDPGSYIDQNYPSAVVNTRYFRGSGTSQAAAVTSGAVALLLQSRPSLTPDQVKQVLISSTQPLAQDGIPLDVGIGRLNVGNADKTLPLALGQSFPLATGLGSIDAARGTTDRLGDDGVVLTGEQDVMGMPWIPQQWAPATLAGTTWNNGWWNGSQWTGDSWSSSAFADGSSDGVWTGRSWSGHTWSGHTWSGSTWSGHTWSGHTWSGRSWSGAFYG
jgi:serine protease AprX